MHAGIAITVRKKASIHQNVCYARVWRLRMAKRWFDTHSIPYKYINIAEDENAAAYVVRVNRGMRSVPTIVFPDGSILVEPSVRELAAKFSLDPPSTLRAMTRTNPVHLFICCQRQQGTSWCSDLWLIPSCVPGGYTRSIIQCSRFDPLGDDTYSFSAAYWAQDCLFRLDGKSYSQLGKCPLDFKLLESFTI